MKQPLFFYITVAFIAPVVFFCCTNNRDGYSHHLIFFFTAVLSFGRRCFFLYQAYWIFWHSYSYWVLATVMLTSLSKLLPGKWPRAFASYIHDSSSLACRNSYCVHHNVSNSLLPLTVFGRESCLKFCYPVELCTRYEIAQFLVSIIRFERIPQTRSKNSEKLFNYDLSSEARKKKHFYRLENPSKLPVFFALLFQTIMDKSIGTLLHFWSVFQFTQVQPLP